MRIYFCVSISAYLFILFWGGPYLFSRRCVSIFTYLLMTISAYLFLCAYLFSHEPKALVPRCMAHRDVHIDRYRCPPSSFAAPRLHADRMTLKPKCLCVYLYLHLQMNQSTLDCLSDCFQNSAMSSVTVLICSKCSKTSKHGSSCVYTVS